MPDKIPGDQSPVTPDAQPSASEKGSGWWMILVGFAIGAVFPLVNRTLRQQMMSGEIPYVTTLGMGALGAAAASLLVIQSRIKHLGLRWLFLGVGILIVVVGASVALLMFIE
ncbi:MAG: hypothetical protein R3336_08615 [Phycisphaeraceae bacterium]|nr:hypothetical protein [Phycisphaeraceae bacterium]